ncbi:hypothetical protein ACFL59_06750 [Planctomycetota bacterium]
MQRHTATGHKGGCSVCGAHIGGPWLACSELCWFLLNAEQQLAGDAVAAELGEAEHKRNRSGDGSGRFRRQSSASTT